jgi:hypothetical protein
MADAATPPNDPRLAHTGGVPVLGREIIDDNVLLQDFERLLEMGEAMERGEDVMPDDLLASVDELLGFFDRHGRRPRVGDASDGCREH